MAGGGQGAGAPQGQNPLAGLNQGNFNPQALQNLVQGGQGMGASQGTPYGGLNIAKPMPYGGAGGQQMQMPLQVPPNQGTPYGGTQMPLGTPDINEAAQAVMRGMQQMPVNNPAGQGMGASQGTPYGGAQAAFYPQGALTLPGGEAAGRADPRFFSNGPQGMPQGLPQRSPVFMPGQMQRPQIQGNPNAQTLPSRDRMMRRFNPMFNRTGQQ